MLVLLHLLTFILPWSLRRWVLVTVFGYHIHPTARIAIAFVFPKKLIMGERARIGLLTICKGLDLLEMGPDASIGRLNWITAYPKELSRHFSTHPSRNPCLTLAEHAHVTNRHLIDCTDQVIIGKFTTVAGFGSQLLTHSIDLEHNVQTASPIVIGDYCFVGTDCTILKGARLPSYTVLGAKSLLNKKFDEEAFLYAGVPARAVHPLPREWVYFNRKDGFVQ